MSNFSTKKSKPSTQDYLDADLEEVLDRQNQNPNGLQSEDYFCQSVIAVRAAKINEKLSNRLNFLTGVIALATLLLVIVPFFIPSFEAGQLGDTLEGQQSLIKAQEGRIVELEETLQKMHSRVVDSQEIRSIIRDELESSELKAEVRKVEVNQQQELHEQ